MHVDLVVTTIGPHSTYVMCEFKVVLWCVLQIIGNDGSLAIGIVSNDVCRCHSCISLNWTPIFDWCVVQWGSKNKHHKGTCLKAIELSLQMYVLLHTWIVNTIERIYAFSQEDIKHTLLITITRLEEVHFLVQFFLSMLHRGIANATIWVVEVGEHETRTRITPTYLRWSERLWVTVGA